MFCQIAMGLSVAMIDPFPAVNVLIDHLSNYVRSLSTKLSVPFCEFCGEMCGNHKRTMNRSGNGGVATGVVFC